MVDTGPGDVKLQTTYCLGSPGTEYSRSSFPFGKTAGFATTTEEWFQLGYGGDRSLPGCAQQSGGFARIRIPQVFLNLTKAPIPVKTKDKWRGSTGLHQMWHANQTTNGTRRRGKEGGGGGGGVLHLQERRLALLGRTLTTSLAVKLCERDIPEVNLLHGAVQPGMQELQLCPSVRHQAPFALLIRTYSSTHFGAGLLATHCSGCSHFCSSSDSSSVLSKGDSSHSGTSPSRP